MQNRQVTTTSEPTDLSDITAKVQFLLNDLSWTQKQERDYLEQTYGEKEGGFARASLYLCLNERSRREAIKKHDRHKIPMVGL